MNKKLILNTTTIIIIILLSALPLLIAAYLSIFDGNFYRSSFSKYGVYSKYQNVDLNNYNKEVLDYLTGKKDNMPSEIPLNERELSHMKDVKSVFSFSIYFFEVILIAIFALITLTIYFFRSEFKEKFPEILIKSGIISLSLGILLMIFFYFGFEISFTAFHKLFFKQGTWLFYPTDNIINIYPEGLFSDIFIRVFFLMTIFSLLFILLSFILQKTFIKKKLKKT